MSRIVWFTVNICYKNSMKKRTKIIITSLSLAALMFTYYNIDYKYVPKYEIVGYVDCVKPYATYSLGKVYIIKDESLIDKIDLLETKYV